jgi:hypothetical protein
MFIVVWEAFSRKYVTFANYKKLSAHVSRELKFSSEMLCFHSFSFILKLSAVNCGESSIHKE